MQRVVWELLQERGTDVEEWVRVGRVEHDIGDSNRWVVVEVKGRLVGWNTIERCREVEGEEAKTAEITGGWNEERE